MFRPSTAGRGLICPPVSDIRFGYSRFDVLTVTHPESQSRHWRCRRSASAASAHSAIFPVAPHDDVTIEWWYLNAHVTTAQGRHLAVIGSFFRFGNATGSLAMDSGFKSPQSHYLIYAITDEDTGAHKSFATADSNTLSLLRQALMAKLMMSPNDSRAQGLSDELANGRLPKPTRLFSSEASVSGSPFHVTYAGDNVHGVPGEVNTYVLSLGSGQYRCKLTFHGTRPPMYVGGDGNTGTRQTRTT